MILAGKKNLLATSLFVSVTSKTFVQALIFKLLIFNELLGKNVNKFK
jgi:hypothetical protein